MRYKLTSLLDLIENSAILKVIIPIKPTISRKKCSINTKFIHLFFVKQAILFHYKMKSICM